MLIARDVLGWSANETAELLAMTVASADSALQRGRATLQSRLPDRRDDDWSTTTLSAEERELLDRFVDAHERQDVAASAALLRDDTRITMPPALQPAPGMTSEPHGSGIDVEEPSGPGPRGFGDPSGSVADGVVVVVVVAAVVGVAVDGVVPGAAGPDSAASVGPVDAVGEVAAGAVPVAVASFNAAFAAGSAPESVAVSSEGAGGTASGSCCGGSSSPTGWGRSGSSRWRSSMSTCELSPSRCR